MMSHEVHVWRLRLTAEPWAVRILERALAADERERAQRFLFTVHRDRYIQSRAFLRHVLSRFLGGTPEEVRFQYGRYGKPELAGSEQPLGFNLSHAGEWAMLSVCAAGRIGIDIEPIRPDHVTPGLVSQVFAPNEQRALAELPPQRHAEAFFKGWCSKEAYVKGLGLGFSRSLHSFEVCVDPDRPHRLLKGSAVDGSWFLHGIPVAAEYAGVLAIDREPVRITASEWGSADFGLERERP